MNDEHEILSHKILEELKYDVEALKKKLSEPEAATQELITEMEELKLTAKELQNIFKEALHDIKEEDSNKLLLSLQNKIETVTTQNETIARGMVAISDRLDDFMKKQQSSFPSRSAPSSFPSSTPPMPLRMSSPHSLSPRIPPPLPETRSKRQSIFK